MTEYELCIKKKRERGETVKIYIKKDCYYWRIKLAVFDILRIPLISFKCIFYQELEKNPKTRNHTPLSMQLRIRKQEHQTKQKPQAPN